MKKKVELKKLSPKLPDECIARWGTDEDGDDVKVVGGFGGNISGSAKYVTDGHVLVLASAIPAKLRATVKDDADYCGKKRTAAQCKVVLDNCAQRENMKAEFIGTAQIVHSWIGAECATTPEDYHHIAVIRDTSNRILIVDAHLFAFALRYTLADSIAVDAGVKHTNTPLRFYKDGAMIALLMPMRFGVSDLEDYDLSGPAVEWRQQ